MVHENLNYFSELGMILWWTSIHQHTGIHYICQLSYNSISLYVSPFSISVFQYFCISVLLAKLSQFFAFSSDSNQYKYKFMWKKIASQIKIKWSYLKILLNITKAFDCKKHTSSFMVLCIYSLKKYLALSFDVPSFNNKYRKDAVLS